MNRQFMFICYDIANKKRLAKVHRIISKEAVMIQYSVYLANMSVRGAKALLKRLEEDVLDAKEDDVRIYAIPSHPDMLWLGKDAEVLPSMLGEAMHFEDEK